MEDSTPWQIRRKPVPISPVSPPPAYTESPISISASAYSGYDSSLFDDYAAERPPPRPQFLTVDDHLQGHAPAHPLRATRSSPNLHQPTSLPQPSGLQQTTSIPQSTKKAEVAQKAGKAVVTAFEEARHFAGGLVSHPYESTKHFSILRHSHGLVFYSGSYTSIAITVFADRELPADRSFWLQRKGWSGNTGLKAGALFGTHSAWLNVTPSVVATANEVKPSDERAWQRDISKFLRNAPKKIAAHVPRETEILRIPCEAEDGYLRIVMCSGENGKKTLCPSPVFRLASTSLEGSSMRGASLKTLPLEAAVKIGTTVGTQVANRIVGPYVQTAKTFASSTVGSVYQPTALQTAAAQEAYRTSGLSDRVSAMNEQYAERRAGSLKVSIPTSGNYNSPTPPAIVGDESGPQAPFPVRFSSKAIPDQAEPPARLGFPTATLSNVPSDITLKHPNGIYIGYASLRLPAKLLTHRNLDASWHAALITIAPSPTPHATVVQKKTIQITILAHDIDHATIPAAKLSILMLGFLRPLSPPLSPLTPQQAEHPEAQAARLHADVAIARASLARRAWAAEAVVESLRQADAGRTLTDRYVGFRQGVQGRVDSVPAHWVGVRTEGMGARDRWVGNGGVSIVR